jgi:tRNA (guanosine-2'-O-)-methyltransferase
VAAVIACRNDGYRIVVAEQTRDAVPPQVLPAVFPVCLVLGSEFHGVSASVLALADAAVAIPVHGMANSLNVSTAAGIILNHLTLAWSQLAEQSE